VCKYIGVRDVAAAEVVPPLIAVDYSARANALHMHLGAIGEGPDNGLVRARPAADPDGCGGWPP
jgi:hypothetical protein